MFGRRDDRLRTFRTRFRQTDRIHQRNPNRTLRQRRPLEIERPPRTVLRYEVRQRTLHDDGRRHHFGRFHGRSDRSLGFRGRGILRLLSRFRPCGAGRQRRIGTHDPRCADLRYEKLRHRTLPDGHVGRRLQPSGVPHDRHRTQIPGDGAEERDENRTDRQRRRSAGRRLHDRFRRRDPRNEVLRYGDDAYAHLLRTGCAERRLGDRVLFRAAGRRRVHEGYHRKGIHRRQRRTDGQRVRLTAHDTPQQARNGQSVHLFGSRHFDRGSQRSVV